MRSGYGSYGTSVLTSVESHLGNPDERFQEFWHVLLRL